MQIYHYDPAEKLFYRTSTARVDPLEVGKWLIPANATTIMPPTTTGYERARFVGGGWEVLQDYRQVPYYVLPDRKPRYVNELGDIPPVNAVFELPPLTEEEKIADLVKKHLTTISINTDDVIENFQYNSNNYKLTRDVIAQVKDIAGLLQNAPDPNVYFVTPLEVVLSEDENGIEEVVQVNTLTGFKNAYVAVMEHVKDKRKEARDLKAALMTMSLAELEAWTDPRI